jgi:phosphatidylglycerophosphatase A
MHPAGDAPDTLCPDLYTPPTGGMTPTPANWRFLLSHPAHFLALGAGAGLSRIAPGTAGTLVAWLSFHLINPWLSDAGWAALLAMAACGGCWISSVTAQHLNNTDPGCIVWDEIVAFWLVLWLITPCSWQQQALAFVVFRLFDALKPGPIGWADRVFHPQSGDTPTQTWRKAGWGIMLDDGVAAACTLLVIATWHFYV